MSADLLHRPVDRPRGAPNGDGPVLVALIPAHDEEASIVATIRSLEAQSRAPDRILVLADNCSDRTAELARAAGAEVMETVDNAAKKAGALNQGLAVVLPTLRDDDLVLTMDADSQLTPTFLDRARGLLAADPSMGGLSGALIAQHQRNLLELAQAVEYARGSRQVARKAGRVHVLSGAATVLRVGVLRDVARSRGTRLPGTAGSVFVEGSLTEDYELTIAVRALGYQCRCSKRCQVVTDVMPTFRDLYTQRLRWYRGAMESLSLYGWSRLTQQTWLQIGFTFLCSLLLPMIALLIVVSLLFFEVSIDWRWAVIWPFMWIDQYVNARRAGVGFVRSLRLFPWFWTYDNLQFFFAWMALIRLAKQSEHHWVTGLVARTRRRGSTCTDLV